MPFFWSVHRGGYCWDGPADARVLTPVPGDQGDGEYAPLEDHTGLFLTFAGTEGTESGILAFANQYGLLGIGAWRDWDVEPDERFSNWADQIQAMRESVARWQNLQDQPGRGDEKRALYDAVNKQLGASAWSGMGGLSLPDRGHQGVIRRSVEALLARFPPPPAMQLIDLSREGKVTLETRPANLLNALWLQLASGIAGDTRFRQCPSCGSWFAVSPERRRADAQYCKELCRITAYKRRKKEARRLHAAGRSPSKIAKELGSTVEIVRGWITEAKG
jgi:hypothetical protein